VGGSSRKAEEEDSGGSICGLGMHAEITSVSIMVWRGRSDDQSKRAAGEEDACVGCDGSFWMKQH